MHFWKNLMFPYDSVQYAQRVFFRQKLDDDRKNTKLSAIFQIWLSFDAIIIAWRRGSVTGLCYQKCRSVSFRDVRIQQNSRILGDAK
jgi:hypothetical protein